VIRYTLRFILLFIVIAILVLTVFYFFPPLRQHLPYYTTVRTFAIMLLRNPFCSFSDARKGLSYDNCFQEQTKIIGQSCGLLKRDEKGFVLWRTYMGSMWAPPGSEEVKPWLKPWGFLSMVEELSIEQKCNQYGTEKQSVRPGDIVLDCGAHIGLFTKKALADGAKMVVAIEPALDNIECLRRNFTKEIEDGQVIVYPKGVWNQEAELSFKTDKAWSADNKIIEGSKEGENIINIPVTTIDKIVSELGIEKVDFIKMDIEGAELNALKGAHQTIVKHHPRMAIATEHTDDFLKNAQNVSTLIRSFADYCTECGPHTINQTGHIAPLVVFFN